MTPEGFRQKLLAKMSPSRIKVAEAGVRVWLLEASRKEGTFTREAGQWCYARQRKSFVGRVASFFMKGELLACLKGSVVDHMACVIGNPVAGPPTYRESKAYDICRERFLTADKASGLKPTP